MGTWNEADHPRVGAGAAGGEGGRFAAKPAAGDDGDLTAGGVPFADAVDTMAGHALRYASVFGGPDMRVDVNYETGLMWFSDAGSGRTANLTLDAIGGGRFHVEVAVPGEGVVAETDVDIAPVEDEWDGCDGLDGFKVVADHGDPARWAVNLARRAPSDDAEWSEAEANDMLGMVGDGSAVPQPSRNGWEVPDPDAPCDLFDRSRKLYEGQTMSMARSLHREYGVHPMQAVRMAGERWMRDVSGPMRRRHRQIIDALELFPYHRDDVRPLAEWAARRDDGRLAAAGRHWLAAHAK